MEKRRFSLGHHIRSRGSASRAARMRRCKRPGPRDTALLPALPPRRHHPVPRNLHDLAEYLADLLPELLLAGDAPVALPLHLLPAQVPLPFVRRSPRIHAAITSRSAKTFAISLPT